MALPVLAGPDDAAAAKAGVTPPTQWGFPAAKPLRVWAIHGLWYPTWALDRAFARLGGVEVTDSWHQQGAIRWYCPETYDELMQYHLIVVADINGGAFANGKDPGIQRKRIKDYVEHGGSVLFLGGWFAYGGEYHNTALEEIAPVTFSNTRDLVQAADGLALAPGEGLTTKANWAAAPRVYWYHAVTPKPDARVLLTAGGKPLLITGTFGKGRVAVFAGTVMGDPPAGQMPFWQWDGWPAVMADTLTWLSAPATQTAAGAGNLPAELTDALGKVHEKGKAELDVLHRLAPRCATAEDARALLGALGDIDSDSDLALNGVLLHYVLPRVDDHCAEVAGRLASAGKVQKTTLGLRLLGACRTKAARAVLLDALALGTVAGEGKDDQTLDDTEAIQAAESEIRCAALDGLALLGDPTTLPDILKVKAINSAALPAAKDFPTDVTPAVNLYQAAALAAVRCGDAASASVLVDQLLLNRYREVNLRFDTSSDGQGKAAEAKRAAAARTMWQLQVWQHLAYRQLNNLPPATWQALAARIAAEPDAFVTPIALAIFSCPTQTTDAPTREAVGKTLQKSSVPAIADLGRMLAP